MCSMKPVHSVYHWSCFCPHLAPGLPKAMVTEEAGVQPVQLGEATGPFQHSWWEKAKAGPGGFDFGRLKFNSHFLPELVT